MIALIKVRIKSAPIRSSMPQEPTRRMKHQLQMAFSRILAIMDWNVYISINTPLQLIFTTYVEHQRETIKLPHVSSLG